MVSVAVPALAGSYSLPRPAAVAADGAPAETRAAASPRGVSQSSIRIVRASAGLLSLLRRLATLPVDVDGPKGFWAGHEQPVAARSAEGEVGDRLRDLDAAEQRAAGRQ